MARQTKAPPTSGGGGRLAGRPIYSIHKLLQSPKISFAIALLFADAVLLFLIINYVLYTKIDWDAYMSQITGFLGGERDYSKLKGDTGPLVYPAGFLYIYSAIQYVTGGEVYPAQVLFGFLYVVNLAMVLFIYLKTDVVPWWALCLLSLSKRVHSIFVLRLFNDCFATTLFHAALITFIYQKWHLGLIIFSGAVSVKMNVLLYAPTLFILLLKAMDIFGVITSLAGAAFVQILLGLPFLLSHPMEYISRAFNLGRVFIHFWYFHVIWGYDEVTTVAFLIIGIVSELGIMLPGSVNFKFVPEAVFVSKQFALLLLAIHLILLVIFCHYRWCRHEGGIFSLIHSKLAQLKLKAAYSSSFPLNQLNESSTTFRALTAEHITTSMFVGNFIGIVCARSLHYQFYSWYFYSLPYLLWRTPFPVWMRLILFAAVELCWNVYPSNTYSSLLLLAAHLTILGGLWVTPPEHPYSDFPSNKSHLKKAS